MLFLKLLGTMWLVYLSLVFVRSFRQSLRNDPYFRRGAGWPGQGGASPGMGGAGPAGEAQPDPFGPFGPFGPRAQFDPYAEARARAEREPTRARPGARAPLEVLGLAPNASDQEIRRTYQDLIRQYHPDRLDQIEGLGPDLRQLADQRSKEINAAYSQLKKKP